MTDPPLGIMVPFVPVAHVSLWTGGSPYYYANGVYCAQVPGQGYAVIEPLPGAEVAQPTSRVTADIDLRECRDWAGLQAGAADDADVIRRALEACLDGRGYSVR